MNIVRNEGEARIELVRSIARSQQAVARILESIADISEHSPGLSKSIRENVRSLTALQLTMAEAVSCVRMRRLKQGIPAKPWLQAGAISFDAAPSEGRSETNGRKLL
ncbi:hypothetical protein KZ483_08920 [Paenibacillus sp. sptzw28]|uniref:hypothetical protein n=1 Tax=Paenibacillus sp. sptzw28 TaxID=715179 RepID=UPI001C6E9C8D|nr:hypothetical protein [Paenibacillus sp. sptzw28]QYR23027.1 hypothetical protein KZ483_08920 [Paenibacillus sp. sptzw28]